MTSRQVWEGMLTELSKVNAPSMLLQDFNYFFNKAINQYINKRYNIYDINQQTTDDLRVLKATTILTPQKINQDTIQGINISGWKAGDAALFGATYEIYLPLDYLHMLNCVCIYKLNKNYKCYNKGDYVQFAAKRLTADTWSVIVNDYYNRPLPERPYYYIHNVNQSVGLPTNPVVYDDRSNANKELVTNLKGTDASGTYKVSPGSGSDLAGSDGSNLPRTISLKGIANKSVVEREAGVRYGNPSSVRCEIRYGKDSSVFELQSVVIDYIKAPQTIRLTQEQVDLTEDTSQIMEFPDYVCQEIINELTMLVMENTADPRLQTNTVVTQSIANPAQQQTPQPQSQQRG